MRNVVGFDLTQPYIQYVTPVSHGFAAASSGTDDPSGHELVINATSLGLRPGDPLPLNVERLTASQTVAEIIMQPAETPLLHAAREKGCRIHFGAPMLACQIELMAAFMGATAGPDGPTASATLRGATS